MVLVFSSVSCILSEEYVQLFSEEKLAVSLFKLAKDTGVELHNASNKTFSIRGNWGNVKHAYDELERYSMLQSELDEAIVEHQVSNVSEPSATPSVYNVDNKEQTPRTAKHAKSSRRGRIPGTSIYDQAVVVSNVPRPLILKNGKYVDSPITNKSNQLRDQIEAKRNSETKETVCRARSNINEHVRDQIIDDNTNVDVKEKNTDHQPGGKHHDLINEGIAIKEEPEDDEFAGDTDVDESYMDNLQDDNVEHNTEMEEDGRKRDSGEFDVKLTKVKAAAVSKKNVKGLKQEAKSKNKNDFSCHLCDYVGTKLTFLNQHIKRIHGKPLSCDVCGNSFGLPKDLKRHKRQVHSDASYGCDECGLVYKSKRSYVSHLQTHKTGYVKQSFPCELCDKMFATKYILTAHVKSVHLGMNKSYMCPTCGRTFTQKSSYLQHANVHAGIKPYVCDVCGLAFTYEKSLKEHKYMHTSERQFKCTVCEKAFKQKTGLVVHMKIHNEKKEHMCQSCGKGFTQSQALHRHERIHSGDKPFKCALCSKTFNDYSIVRRHLIMYHKRDPKESHIWKSDIINCTKRSEFYISTGHGNNNQLEEQTSLLLESHGSEEDTVNDSPTIETDRDIEEPLADIEHSDKQCEDEEPENCLQELSRAEFIANKDIKVEIGISQQVPINFSNNTDLPQIVKGGVSSEEDLFRPVHDSFQPAIVTSSLPPNLRRGTDSSSATDAALSQSVHGQWHYPNYPNYNQVAFPQYQGPSDG